MWIFLLFFFLQANPAPCPPTAPPPTGSPSLIVQAVDPDYLPIFGANVTVKTLGAKVQPISVRTDEEGYARFFVPADSAYSTDSGYSIEVNMPNFKTVRLKQLHLHKLSETPHVAYVQLVMQISPRHPITVY